MDSKNEWNKIVVNAILSNKKVDIKEVNHLESVHSLLFNTEAYSTILSLIKDKQLDSLKEFNLEKRNEFGEYLNVVKFSDQNHKIYVATIYDSDELWQDPQVIDIINFI